MKISSYGITVRADWVRAEDQTLYASFGVGLTDSDPAVLDALLVRAASDQGYFPGNRYVLCRNAEVGKWKSTLVTGVTDAIALLVDSGLVTERTRALALPGIISEISRLAHAGENASNFAHEASGAVLLREGAVSVVSIPDIAATRGYVSAKKLAERLGVEARDLPTDSSVSTNFNQQTGEHISLPDFLDRFATDFLDHLEVKDF